jgi:hypothetical protein
MKEAYSFALPAEQFASAVLDRSRKLGVPGPWRGVITGAAVAFYGALGYLFAAASARRSIASTEVMSVLAGIVLALVVWQLATTIGHRRNFRRARYMCEPRTLRIETDGLRFLGEKSELFLRWSQLTGAAIARDTVDISLDSVTFYPIPLSAFDSRPEAEEFVSLVKGKIGQASGNSLPVQPSPDIEPGTESLAPAKLDWARHRTAAGAMIKDALRIAFFRRLPEGRPEASWGTVLAAALASMSVPVAYALVSVGLHGEWSWYMLSSALFHIPMLLAAAILAAYAVGRPTEVPRILIAGLLASIVIDVVAVSASIALGRSMAWQRVFPQAQWLQAAWLALALGTFVSRWVLPGARRALVLSTCIVLVALPLGGIFHERSLWYAPYSPDDDATGSGGRAGAASEDVLYKQPALLSQELRAVQPPSEGMSNVYFIGVAGYGPQNVFRREVDSVANIFRERFGAQGHIVRLINSRQTLLDVPIASKTSLRAALKRAGDLMDKDRDVLVLYMTSHGSEDHHFALSLWPVSFHEIDPAVLRGLLDESGIRNRVVIISACYSGGFVKPLEDPNTLVITASAANRNSFGCGNEADWTYFGEAYFNEGLRKTHSFVKAFELAKPRIAERERKDQFEPSEPQISVGSRIGATLAVLERQLDGSGVADDHLALAAAAVPAPDKYDEYVALMFAGDALDDMESACRAGLQMSGPDETLAREPNVFGGLERSPRHWMRLTGAWEKYVSTACAKAYDQKTIKTIYGAKVRSVIPERDLEPALQFLHTVEGARWIRLDHEAERQESIELGRVQADVSSGVYKEYLESRDRIFEDFRKSQ